MSQEQISVAVIGAGKQRAAPAGVNIEHEDADYSRLDGLALAAENLRAAAAKI